MLKVDDEYTGETFVVVTMDANEATIAKVGQDFEILWHETSIVPGKFKPGGQSAHRYQQNRDLELLQWLKKCADKIRQVYDNHRIILAGPAQSKEKLFKEFPTYVQTKVVSIVDVGYTTENGIWEAIEKSQVDIENCKRLEEKKIGDEFAKLLAKGCGLVDYGIGPHLNLENVRLILVSEQYKDMFPGYPVQVVRHPVVEALGVCIFKKY